MTFPVVRRSFRLPVQRAGAAEEHPLLVLLQTVLQEQYQVYLSGVGKKVSTLTLMNPAR